MAQKQYFDFTAGVFQGLLPSLAMRLFIFCTVVFNGLSVWSQEVKPVSPLVLTPAKASNMRNVITQEELAKARSSAPNSIQSKKLTPVEKEVAPIKRDIYQMSDILTDGSLHTVIPKGAVLSAPEGLTNRVLGSKPGGKFEFWPDFYAKNQHWIKLQEVDVATAKGEVPLSDAVIKMMQNEPKMVIAVYNGNPVSVLESAPAPDGAAAAKAVKK